MEYQEFVDGINSGVIQKATFSVTGYAHYRNCRVESEIMTNPSGAYIGKIISFRLTPDGSEIRGFVDDIDEKAKLFYIKGKGSFTLKQMWSRITINSIE
ncbi:MAG: hypothetical protein E7625_02555 [Ruminococcaceae bacterium]|nr:hypothetical protein [Oscillospiraceae bacterium]